MMSPAPPPAASGLVATDFVPYVGYTGALNVFGVVGPLDTNGTRQTFAYTLAGVDPACTGASGAANSCGIHIHVGTSCGADAGGHFYTGRVTVDPWLNIVYTATPQGTASGTLTVNTGATGSELEGRAVIIHGVNGQRVACARLEYPAVSPPPYWMVSPPSPPPPASLMSLPPPPWPLPPTG